MYPETKYIKSLLPDWKAKNWQFDIRICPDCHTLQIINTNPRAGTKCEGAGSPLFCDCELQICTKGKHKGELMWTNENWD